ncbi:MAG: hypothetical protein ACR2FP_01635 [Nocardioidaceae bacterium]
MSPLRGLQGCLEGALLVVGAGPVVSAGDPCPGEVVRADVGVEHFCPSTVPAQAFTWESRGVDGLAHQGVMEPVARSTGVDVQHPAEQLVTHLDPTDRSSLDHELSRLRQCAGAGHHQVRHERWNRPVSGDTTGHELLGEERHPVRELDHAIEQVLGWAALEQVEKLLLDVATAES